MSRLIIKVAQSTGITDYHEETLSLDPRPSSAIATPARTRTFEVRVDTHVLSETQDYPGLEHGQSSLRPPHTNLRFCQNSPMPKRGIVRRT
jgi:hypothetical protein